LESANRYRSILSIFVDVVRAARNLSPGVIEVAEHESELFLNCQSPSIDIGQISVFVDVVHFSKYEMVEFRDFKYSLYPEYVRIVREYRWKPLIIAVTLMEFDAIWYMDSSVVFKKGNLSHVHDLINCRRTVTARPPMKSIAERDLRESRTSIERGWDYNLWKQNLAECRKAAFLMNGFTGHGIYTATSPEIYSFIPTNFEEIKKEKAKMYESGLTLVVKAKDTMEQILKCDSVLICDQNSFFEKIYFSKTTFAYAGCAKTISVLNVLVANTHWYDKHYYASEIVDFFSKGQIRQRLTAI
uniref:Polyprotein n=1 Tax=Heligmosomoides polygyrus TaxID=6339 RepID=A0A8L8K4G1_HELPZ